MDRYMIVIDISIYLIVLVLALIVLGMALVVLRWVAEVGWGVIKDGTYRVPIQRPDGTLSTPDQESQKNIDEEVPTGALQAPSPEDLRKTKLQKEVEKEMNNILQRLTDA